MHFGAGANLNFYVDWHRHSTSPSIDNLNARLRPTIVCFSLIVATFHLLYYIRLNMDQGIRPDSIRVGGTSLAEIRLGNSL